MRMEDKRQPVLEDTDLMFFGKFEKTPLQDVPPDYLMWAWENTGLKQMSKHLNEQEIEELKKKPWVYKRTMLANYIYNSMDAIKLELKGK